MMRRLSLVAIGCLWAMVCVHPARADDEAAARNERWAELQRAIFPGRTISDGAGVIQLDAPPRALDAALVPFTITLPGDRQIKSVFLVIDNNPGPLAGHFAFGAAADPRTLKVRMRVNTYTNVHAIAEDSAGKLYAAEKFVKASGGCSAPAGSNDEESMRNLGQMKLKLLNEFAAGAPVQAQLMIRHPNFNGMQMDQLTRLYAPAHFIRMINITYEGQPVLRIDSDIALSTDPVLTFGFTPRQPGRLRVEVNDSKEQSFVHEFPVP
ncbi:MAG TPA: quinoprotein dehydrogenase-associated SoxYZ-like carrier, partial [Povalibacter sp.]|nr:quinoprotein dehydrogenase-associated SoxYZ-like carrier [Povalibacter sp.]